MDGHLAGRPSDESKFVVAYVDDDVYTFSAGARMRFGRDDEHCEIPIWEAVNDRALSKVAGELWCANEQMWVRNLSTAHELVISGRTASRVLPARLGFDPGHACSVPSPGGTVAAPSTGTWKLTVSRVGTAGALGSEFASRDGDCTLRVEDVPDKHRRTAEALCAPLLDGSSTHPATYTQIAASQGWTERVARRRVEELCACYRNQVEALPGGRSPDETLAQAVARALVTRGKLAAWPADDEPARGGWG